MLRLGPKTSACGLAPFLLLASVLWTAACAREETPDQRGITLGELDTVLTELGGRPTADLTRGQRWRMISSVGAGLPPSNFEAVDLPEPGSHGAVLVEAYCDRCHWIPAPQMHSAAEWPILVRRMKTRAQTLQDRMGGEIMSELVGEVLSAGMATAPVPSEEEVGIMIEYLQTHALRAVAPGELGEGEDVGFYVARCATCHDTPSPAVHTAAEWPAVVARMQANATLMDVRPLAEDEVDQVVVFLQSRAPR